MQPDTEQQQLPQSDIVIEKLPLDLQEHNLRQIGYELVCDPCPAGWVSAHGHRLKPGMMLIGSKGDWSIAPEGGIKREM